jgi:hypothetical protein
MPTIDKESAFAELVRDHENQWVAIIETDGIEFVVGTGQTAVEAAKDAASKGHPQAMLFRVPSSDVRFVY